MRRLFITAASVLAVSGCASVGTPVGNGKAIIPATAWGSVPAASPDTRTHRIDRITLHHGGELIDPARSTEAYLQALQAWSRREKGWADVPYHFLIDRQGRVFEGRAIDVPGDTNTAYNPTGHALIVVLGNFEEEQPNDAQLAAVVDTMAQLVVRYQLPLDSIASHRDYSAQTACPGKNLSFYLLSGWFHDHVRERVAEIRQAGPR
jgi:hypothetical protein